MVDRAIIGVITEDMAQRGRHADGRSDLVTTTGRRLVEIFPAHGGRESTGRDTRPSLVYEENIEGGLIAVGIHHELECVIRTIDGELLPLPTGQGTRYPNIDR